MKSIVLNILCLLAVWWGLLTVHTILLHRRRVRLAAQLAPEDKKSYGEFMMFNRARVMVLDRRIRFKIYVLKSPLILLFLPCWLYAWFGRDPFEHNDPTV
jgi:hypothetical protein